MNDHIWQLEELPIVPVSDPPAPNDRHPFDPDDDRRGRLVVVGLVFALVFLLIAALVWWATDPDGARGDALAPEPATAPEPAQVVAAPASSAPSSTAPTPALDAYPMPAKQAVPPPPEPVAPEQQPPPAEPMVEVAPAPTTAPPTTEPIAATTVGTVAPAATSIAPQPTLAPSTTAPATTSAPAAVVTTTTAAPTTTPSTTVEAPASTVATQPTTLLDTIATRPELSRLRELVGIAGLEAELTATEPRTLLAPSDAAIDAFAATPQGEAVLADPESLRQLLLRHLVDESLDATAMFSDDRLQAMSGDTLVVDANARTVEGAELLVADLAADTGFVHVVSRVLDDVEPTDAG